MQFKLILGDEIILESSLSFDFFIQLLAVSLGNLLINAQEYMTTHPWLATFQSIMVFIAVPTINCIGDALREVIDPIIYSNETTNLCIM